MYIRLRFIHINIVQILGHHQARAQIALQQMYVIVQHQHLPLALYVPPPQQQQQHQLHPNQAVQAPHHVQQQVGSCLSFEASFEFLWFSCSLPVLLCLIYILLHSQDTFQLCDSLFDRY